MNQITDEQINERLAGYMGLNIKFMNGLFRLECGGMWMPFRLYTESLDALVSVCEKLQKQYFVYMDSFWESGYFQVKIVSAEDEILVKQSSKSPSKALSLALYHVIGEIDK